MTEKTEERIQEKEAEKVEKEGEIMPEPAEAVNGQDENKIEDSKENAVEKDSIGEEPEDFEERSNEPAAPGDSASTGEKEEASEEKPSELTVSEENTGGKQENAEKKHSKRAIAGVIELGAALILAALAMWLFLNTIGTRLLYVSVALGRASRYYWIAMISAVIFLVMGVFTLKTYGREKKERQEETSPSEETAEKSVEIAAN